MNYLLINEWIHWISMKNYIFKQKKRQKNVVASLSMGVKKNKKQKNK